MHLLQMYLQAVLELSMCIMGDSPCLKKPDNLGK